MCLSYTNRQNYRNCDTLFRMLGKRLFGSRDYTPKEAKGRQQLEDTLKQVFQNAGFEQVILPTLELFDSIKLIGAFEEESCVSFLDHQQEKVVLRPDPTAAIARLISTRMQQIFPLKLSYFNPVFRKQKDNNIQEWYQAGVEFIGANQIDSDAYVLDLCIQSLQALGLQNFQIDINHPQQFQNFKKEDRQHLLNSDYLSLGYLPKRTPLKDWQGQNLALLSLKKAELYSEIFVNEALVKDLKYYDGIYFEVTLPGFPFVLATGGRYDQLLKKVNLNEDAIGFAIHLNRIQHVLEQSVSNE